MSEYVMDYIADKDLYKAAMFAKKMCKNGTAFHTACGIAARTYGVRYEDVQKYMAQSSGRTQGWRKHNRSL